MTTDVVSVSAPARLHLGFLDMHGGLGRRFGGIGMAVSAPATRLSLTRAPTTLVEGPEKSRARWHLEAMRSHLGLAHHDHHLVVSDVIPAHAGLGSGTQLALAVAAALRRLNGLPLDPEGDAAVLGRGSRSGVGAGFFSDGGFLVDGGKGARDLPPPVIARLPFPPAWRVILVLDPARHGLAGSAEVDAFAALPAFSEHTAAEICRLVLMQLLPALVETDLPSFGAALGEIQTRVGEHFAAAQGGLFTSPRVASAMAQLKALGATGIGQSSWGPTGFALVPSEAQARALVADLERPGPLSFLIARGRNTGATVTAL